MKSLFGDSPPAIERLLVEGYRRMTPQQKIQRVISLNRALNRLAEARLRTQYGREMSERELNLRLASLRLDRDVMVAVFGWDPEHEGY